MGTTPVSRSVRALIAMGLFTSVSVCAASTLRAEIEAEIGALAAAENPSVRRRMAGALAGQGGRVVPAVGSAVREGRLDSDSALMVLVQLPLEVAAIELPYLPATDASIHHV